MIRRFPSVFLLVFVISGIVLADLSRIPSAAFLLLCLLSCLTGFFVLGPPRERLAAVLFAVSLAAFSAFHFAVRYYDLGPNHVARLAENPRQFHIFGRVADWPDLKMDRTEIKISVDSVPDAGLFHVSGCVLLRISDTTTVLQRGDRVEFYGRIYPIRKSAPPFDYGRYLNMKGVFGTVYLSTLLDVRIDQRNRYGILAHVDQLRDAIRNILYRNLSPTSAALACGFLIGETRNIPTQVYQRFRDSGTLHLLAVSGSNVALILLFFVLFLRPLAVSPVRRAIILLSIILTFSLLSYGEPSVVRAAVMAALVIIAGLLQRRHDLNNVIAVAATIILLADPAQLFDIGFQLSFVIAWGLIFILPRITELFQTVQSRWWYRWLIFPFLVSTVAQVCSIGIIGFYFERVPLISPLANLIIVPLVSIAVMGVLVVLLAHLLLPSLGLFAGAWLDILLKLTLVLVRALGSETMPSLKVPDTPMWMVASFYLFLLLTILALRRIRLRRAVLVVSLVALNAGLLAAILSKRNSQGMVTITLFQVPGGITAVVQPSESRTADMVITGMDTRQYSVCSRIIKPQLFRLGVNKIGSVFVLAAEFDAARDILQMAISDSVRNVYVEQQLRTSFLDALDLAPTPEPECRIVSLGRTAGYADSLGPVYCKTGSGLVLSASGSRLIFCDRIEPDRFKPSETAADAILIIGRPFCISERDLPQLFHAGYRHIVCSNIEQRKPGQHPSQGGAGSAFRPEHIDLLSLRGIVTLNL
ncbi:MAG: ComEC family competence protein [Candidatus Zixiibacteriota bacterium]|nr:MAG: ComEC family competence protein [candidate division Zixibacteria bacterium]